jgi:OOP family OmpA-OmpF porin
MADGNGGSSLDQLRSLLVGPEQDRLEHLEQRLDDSAPAADDVSEVLPTAITLSAARDDRLKSALAPLMEDSIYASVRRDPQPLADAIFPVIGPAIRKAIAAAIGGLVQTLNQALEHTFSLQGLRWRFEALRTGVSFGEIVLRHSLVYRVEQVFLVHRSGGLLLLHVKDEAIPEQAPEMIAGMLSAIQDFARDSFQVGSRDTLETMQVGELSVMVEDGPHALVAGVVRGHPPLALKTSLGQAVETIHAMYGEKLALFDGDASPFAGARPVLERCLAREVAPPPSRGRWRFWLLAAAALAAVALLLVPRMLENRRWGRFVRSVSALPGIVVAEAGRRDGRYFISGLRDPAAASPESLLAAAGVPEEEVAWHWEPYHSQSPALTVVRVSTLLASEIAEVEGQTLYYPVGQDEPDQAAIAAIPQLAGRIRAIGRAAERQGVATSITIRGQTDETGDPAVNQRLGQARAERIRQLLDAAGAGVPLIAAGAGLDAAPPGADPAARAQRRRVTFAVSFTPR